MQQLEEQTLEDFKKMIKETDSTILTVVDNMVVINSMADGKSYLIKLDHYDEETEKYCLSFL